MSFDQRPNPTRSIAIALPGCGGVDRLQYNVRATTRASRQQLSAMPTSRGPRLPVAPTSTKSLACRSRSSFSELVLCRDRPEGRRAYPGVGRGRGETSPVLSQHDRGLLEGRARAARAGCVVLARGHGVADTEHDLRAPGIAREVGPVTHDSSWWRSSIAATSSSGARCILGRLASLECAITRARADSKRRRVCEWPCPSSRLSSVPSDDGPMR